MGFTHLDIAKLDLRWQVGTIGIACNVFQLQCFQSSVEVVPDVDVMTEMGTYMESILTPMAPHIVVSVDVTSLNLYKKQGALWNLVGPCPISFTPSNTDDPEPSGVAALMTAYTAVSKVVGKKYLPGLADTRVTAGLWISAVLAAMLQSGLAWIAPWSMISHTGTSWYPGVWSLKKTGFELFASSIATRDVPAYQRRRKAGVGA